MAGLDPDRRRGRRPDAGRGRRKAADTERAAGTGGGRAADQAPRPKPLPPMPARFDRSATRARPAGQAGRNGTSAGIPAPSPNGPAQRAPAQRAPVPSPNGAPSQRAPNRAPVPPTPSTRSAPNQRGPDGIRGRPPGEEHVEQRRRQIDASLTRLTAAHAGMARLGSIAAAPADPAPADAKQPKVSKPGSNKPERRPDTRCEPASAGLPTIPVIRTPNRPAPPPGSGSVGSPPRPSR